MKNNLSIDQINSLKNISPREKLRKFFPINSKFRVGCLRTYQLLTLQNGKKSVSFEDDIIMTVRDIKPGGPRWLIYTDSENKEYGLALEAMLGYHRKGIVEIERYYD